MKWKTLLSLLLVVLFGYSCSEDAASEDQQLTLAQIESVSGLYNLSEYIVNPPQDLNQDDTFSADLMEELDCLTGSIILREDLTYSKYYEELDITFITNEQYAIFCGEYKTENGTWDFVNEDIVLSGEPDWVYSLNGAEMVLTLGEDLPEFRIQTYLKQ